MIRSYQLQLAGSWEQYRGIITGNEWLEVSFYGHPPERHLLERTGGTIVYPEHDLLWIGCCWHGCAWRNEKTRFKTLEDFEKEFSSLPRWEATRYAVLETPANLEQAPPEDVSALDLFLFDCLTGQPLNGDSPPGREAEVARLRRGIEQLMRGEHFSFL